MDHWIFQEISANTGSCELRFDVRISRRHHENNLQEHGKPKTLRKQSKFSTRRFPRNRARAQERYSAAEWALHKRHNWSMHIRMEAWVEKLNRLLIPDGHLSELNELLSISKSVLSEVRLLRYSDLSQLINSQTWNFFPSSSKSINNAPGEFFGDCSSLEICRTSVSPSSIINASRHLVVRRRSCDIIMRLRNQFVSVLSHIWGGDVGW